MNDLKQKLEALREKLELVGENESAEALNYLLDVIFPYWEEMEDSVEELIGRIRMMDNEFEDRVTKSLGRKLGANIEKIQFL